MRTKLHIYISHQKHNKPVLMSEKDQSLEIENAQIFVCMLFQVAYK